jgi:hypothetical protein
MLTTVFLIFSALTLAGEPTPAEEMLKNPRAGIENPEKSKTCKTLEGDIVRPSEPGYSACVYAESRRLESSTTGSKVKRSIFESVRGSARMANPSLYNSPAPGGTVPNGTSDQPYNEHPGNF